MQWSIALSSAFYRGQEERLRPEHCIYSAFSHAIRLVTCRQLSMSSVSNPGTCWYFWATSECTSYNRKKGNHSYMQNVQFRANSHIREQALYPPFPLPHPPFFFPGGISLTCQQNKLTSTSILMVFLFLFKQKLIRCDGTCVNIYTVTVEHF